MTESTNGHYKSPPVGGTVDVELAEAEADADWSVAELLAELTGPPVMFPPDTIGIAWPQAQSYQHRS